jgi:hypothetical protein
MPASLTLDIGLTSDATVDPTEGGYHANNGYQLQRG